MDNKPNERTFHGGILMKNHPIINGTVTVEGWKENLTCLQKILMIDKLIREYKKAFEELKAEYEKIAPIIDDYDTIIQRFNTIDGEIDSISDDIEDLKGRVTDCEDDITSLDGRVDDLETAVSGMSGDLGDLETLLAGKQDTLVSGTNIKTINGQSILGSGDITIAGNSEIVYYESNEVSGFSTSLTGGYTVANIYDDFSAGKMVIIKTQLGKRFIVTQCSMNESNLSMAAMCCGPYQNQAVIFAIWMIGGYSLPSNTTLLPMGVMSNYQPLGD